MAAGNYTYALGISGNAREAYSWGCGSNYVLGTLKEDNLFKPL